MSRAHKFILSLVAVHFSLIGLKAFGNINRDHRLLEHAPWLAVIVETITEATVLQADYGFFSPNIAAGNRLTVRTVTVDGDTTNVPLPLPGNEVGLRFHTSMTVFRSIPAYRELVARSLAAKATTLHPDAAEVVVSAYEHVLPTRAQYRARQREGETLFFQAVFATSRGRKAALLSDASPDARHE